jgi:hypothetical protein
MLALRVLQLGVDDLEGAGKRDADPTRYFGKSNLGVLAIGQVERRPRS